MGQRKASDASAFIKYLTENTNGEMARLPSLPEISKELGLSVPTLREQMEVARVMGFSEAKPRMGIRRLAY